MQLSQIVVLLSAGTITEPPTEAKSTPEVNSLGSAVVTPSFTSAEAFKSASGITFEGAAMVEDKIAQVPKKPSQHPSKVSQVLFHSTGLCFARPGAVFFL